jgi:hypothetical protein
VSWRLVAVSLLIAWLVAGCSAVASEPPSDFQTSGSLPSDLQPSDLQPCGELYSTQRCLAMTDEAASRTGRTRDDVTEILIVPLPSPEPGVVTTRSGRGFDVRLTFTDGTTSDQPMCGGIGSGPACLDTPRLEARSSVADGGGYHDIPCPEPPPPEGCGTPLPTLEAAAVAGARPLSIARFPIPIDHLGSYEVPLGEVSLPNGVVTAASFAFVDDWPMDVSLAQGVAQIELRSLEPDGKPFQNYYDHGWRPGVERAEAVLVFDVLWFETGSVLGIRDVVVR